MVEGEQGIAQGVGSLVVEWVLGELAVVVELSENDANHVSSETTVRLGVVVVTEVVSSQGKADVVVVDNDERGHDGEENEEEVDRVGSLFVETHEHEQEGSEEEELEVVREVPHLSNALLHQFPRTGRSC